MAEKDSYVPKIPWAEFLDSIRHRYPYVMPTAIEEKVHPTPTIEGTKHVIPGGTFGQHRRPKKSYFRI